MVINRNRLHTLFNESYNFFCLQSTGFIVCIYMFLFVFCVIIFTLSDYLMKFRWSYHVEYILGLYLLSWLSKCVGKEIHSNRITPFYEVVWLFWNQLKMLQDILFLIYRNLENEINDYNLKLQSWCWHVEVLKDETII